MIGRIAVIIGSVAAGAVVGAFVFKMIGEERIGGEVKILTARLGFPPARPGDDSALQLIERVAPGTRASFESAIVGTTIAAMIATAATTIAVREIAG